jgi:hypothetical protein
MADAVLKLRVAERALKARDSLLSDRARRLAVQKHRIADLERELRRAQAEASAQLLAAERTSFAKERLLTARADRLHEQSGEIGSLRKQLDVLARVLDQRAPKQRKNLLLASMPKAGTHLLVSIIDGIFGRAPKAIRQEQAHVLQTADFVAQQTGHTDFIFYGHLRAPANHVDPGNWQVICLIRDPRDVALSMLDHIQRSSDDTHVRIRKAFESFSLREQLNQVVCGFSMEGERLLAPIAEHCSGWVEWQRQGALVLKYEELATTASINELASFLGVSSKETHAAVVRGFGTRTATLNKGQAGRWREEMDAELISIFREHDRGVVEGLGYAY